MGKYSKVVRVELNLDGITQLKAQDGVRDYLLKARDELAKTMAYTGCADLRNMDPSIIRYDFLRR